MKHVGRLLFLLAASLAVGCSASGGVEPGAVMLSPTPGVTVPALRPATPAATGDATMVDEAATPTSPDTTIADAPPAATADPYQDEATLLVLSQLEEDSTALLEFMQSDPARRAMVGGTYIEHPTGVQVGAPDSYNVLQLVATQEEADALREQLPPLNFPDRLQIELVTCTEAHLNELMAQRRPALDAAGIMIGQSLDTKANRVALLVKASADYVVVDGLIDQSTLPPDIAAELADSCLTVSQGTDTIAAGDDPLDGTNWQLVSVPGYEAIIERLSADRVPTLAFAEGGFVFTTGCNDPSGYYAVDGDSLIATGVMMHLVNCSGEIGEDGMALEQALADAAGTFTTYTLTGDELRIGYADGELVWRRMPDEMGAADPLDGTRWQLVSMRGLDDIFALLSADQLPSLSFPEGGFRFDTGCNNPGGNYVVRGSQLEVSAVRTTTMLCSAEVDDPAPQIESALATIASTLESYSISGDELRLGYPGGELVLNRLFR